MPVFPFSARKIPPSLVIRPHRHSDCSNLNSSNVDPIRPNHWDRGVHGGSQSGLPDLNVIGPNPNSTRFPMRRSPTQRFLFNCGERSTAASSFHKIDRSRSPSPPALVPEKRTSQKRTSQRRTSRKRTSPTKFYMQLSLRSSFSLADPTMSRKLLILDLRGTLLLRGAFSRHGPRVVRARPYLPSFLAYIFHPTTLQWLDTMVWSLAHFQNVNDMVDKCFGTYKEGLKAVWSSSNLGLSNDAYYKNTKIIKDLDRPWAQISSLVPTHPNSEVDAERDKFPSVLQQHHSSLTTIMLDSFTINAVLQPWNYLRVSVYEREKHKLDVQIAERERLLRQQLEVHGKEEIGRVEEEERYDELLLAVIGILDALKHEGNVAGWMRSGGLVHVGEAASSTPNSDDKDSVSIPIPIQSPLLWYEKPSVLSHWAQRGRKALAELEVDIIHGVVPDPEKRTSPTESYMQLSLQPSLPLANSTASRKLLVLDLNGTLLLRSAFSNHGIPRIVYARPYLPSFLTYIFHPTTLQWLDTMVWSSAQSPNVKDMVDKCFGTYKEGLKAVWTRDDLGLSIDDYYAGSPQASKDLARPWEHVPSLISNQSHRPDSEVDAARDNLPSTPQQQHSALTTISLDNFPRHAVLQPWNHLCVSEYGHKSRRLDVQIAERESELERRNLDVQIAELELYLTWLAEWEGAKEKEQERKEKKRLLLTNKQQLEELERYDELLLAVIGILDALKHEGNVAGWIRSGGLVRVGDDQETISETPETETPVITTTAEAVSSTPTSGNKDSVLAELTAAPIQSPLWYEIPTVFSHWAQRGRKALAGLRIDAIHGVHVVPAPEKRTSPTGSSMQLPKKTPFSHSDMVGLSASAYLGVTVYTRQPG